MDTIELKATSWKSINDFYDAILRAIGAPEWHGRSPDALVDSMIWGGINALEPPYTIRIVGTAATPENVRDCIDTTRWAIEEGRKDYQKQLGGDIGVTIEIIS